jgi:hypothetical protein
MRGRDQDYLGIYRAEELRPWVDHQLREMAALGRSDTSR